MAETIELAGMTVTAIQVIWKPEYYSQKPIWHLRVSYQDLDDDEDIECLAELPRDAEDAVIIENVAGWLFDVDGLTASEQQKLRGMIEVKR